MPLLKKCEYCGKEYFIKPYQEHDAKYCSRDCMNNARRNVKKEGKWITKNCPSCGKEFETLKSKEKKYCSQQCNENRFDKKIPERPCDYCEKLFIPKSSAWNKFLRGEQKTLTCSRECSSQLKKKGIEIPCKNCGKMIYRTPYRLEKNENQFCSINCEKEFQHFETYEIRKCEICGTEFECSKLSTQRFCNIQCQGKWQSTQIGELNPRSKRTKVQCDYCNNDVFVTDSILERNKFNFCNEKCRQNWYAEIWSQTDEWKEQSRKRATKILSDGLIPFTNSKPQIIINNILDDLNIFYTNEYNVIYYCIDNYLNDNNLAIEVMGDYWHSNPLSFDYSKLNETQLKRISKDKAKHTYILKYYGFEILYLWENDINNHKELCKKLILEYIKNNGILKDYNSFNYFIDNDKLLLKEKIIKPYFGKAL